MSDFHSEFEFVHFGNTSDFEVDIGLEVSGIFLVEDERLHLALKELNVFQGGIKGDVHEQLLSHGF